MQGNHGGHHAVVRACASVRNCLQNLQQLLRAPRLVKLQLLQDELLPIPPGRHLWPKRTTLCPSLAAAAAAAAGELGKQARLVEAQPQMAEPSPSLSGLLVARRLARRQFAGES